MREFRNLFTFAVYPDSGRIFINEEGENAWEKNNRGEAGANSGWPYCEGPNRFGRGPAAELLAGRPNLLLQPRGPFRGHGCAITAGAFYTPQQGQLPSGYPECYFFADVCNGWIRRYEIADDSASELATGVKFSVDLDVSEDGYLFYLSRRTGGTTTASGAITRVSYPAP